MSPRTTERQAQVHADIAAALQNPRRPRWTTAEKARHRADLMAALNGTEWHQPIATRTRKARR